jgi:hypothetical protein
LIKSRFSAVRSAGALLKVQEMRELIGLRTRGNPAASFHESVVLWVEAVALRPMMTLSEDRKVDGPNHMFKIDIDGFDQIRRQAQAFTAFLKKYWKQAYSTLVGFQLQPLNPRPHCGVIHAKRTSAQREHPKLCCSCSL